MSDPRKVSVSIQYNGKNITAKLAEFLSKFSYTDVASGESDSISINLHNIDKRWLKNWIPSKGDQMIAKIHTKNWNKEGDKKTFKCGSFTIDDYGFKGRPLTATIGAVSIPAMESFKTTERTKTWESITIESVAKEIAKRARISLYYEAKSVKINSLEQSKQTDSAFLYSICESYGLAMKVYSNKIILFDEETYESKKSVVTIKETDMISWSYQTTLTKTYTGAEISYTDASTEKDINVKVGSGSDNRILKLNQKCDSIQDAELKANAAVNSANKKMTTMKITIKANTKIVASSNVTIKGLGKLDGKYAVDKVVHNIGSGYTMLLDLRLIQVRIGVKSNIKSLSLKDDQYIIKKGDTLWIISKKVYGSGEKYMEIYNENSDVIEAAAAKHGKANSNNGSVLYEGTVIKI
jgi:phage protein D